MIIVVTQRSTTIRAHWASSPRITGAAGLALTALISATFAVFSQTRASTALRLVPIASRWRRGQLLVERIEHLLGLGAIGTG